MVSMLMLFLVVQPVLCQYVITIAGNGTGSFADGPALNAMFYYPECLVLDSIGNIYVADLWNDRIRKISTSGYVSTVAGNGTTSYADGPGTNAMFNLVNGITLDTLGNLYVTDFGNHMIRKVNSSGYVSTFAGSIQGWNDGQGLNAQFNGPERIAIDLQGNLFVADTFNSRVRKINSTGYVSTVAGSGALDYADGQGLNASFHYTTGVAVDSQGNIYVSDFMNLRIRKINTTYFVSTLAGSDASGFADGQGSSASFKNPYGLAVDSALNVYVADTDNNRIRVINSTGFVSTIAGNGSASFADGLAVNAMFNAPVGIAVDGLGNLYVGDSYNHRIRRINGSIKSTTSITFSSSSTLFISASTLAITRITSNTSISSTSITSTTITSTTITSTTITSTTITSTSSISSTSTSETISSTSSSSTSTTSTSSISSTSPASSTSSSSVNSLSFSSISSTTFTSSSYYKSILQSSINSPTSISAPLNQIQSTPFYLKAEFMYSAFAGFFVFLIASIMIAFNIKKDISKARSRRWIGPPSQVQLQYMREQYRTM